MSSHAKASSAGTNAGSGRGLPVGTVGLLALLVGLVAAALGASAAQGANSFSPAGSFGEGVVNGPARIAVDEDSGNVLVVDAAAGKVDVFDSIGPGAALLTSFGEGELSSPYGIAIDPASGSAYVTDPGNGRIVRYLDDGADPPTYSLDAGYASPASSPAPEAGAPDGTIGDFTSAIAVDPTSGDLLIADRGDNRVSRFDGSGAFVSDFDGSDSPAGAFTHLEDIVVAPAGEIFVIDSTAPNAATGGLARVLRFAGSGAFQLTLRPPAATGDTYLAFDDAPSQELIVGDGRETFFGSTVFHILDPATGALLFNVNVPSEQLSGVAVDAKAKRLYAASARGEFFGVPSVLVFTVQVHPDLVLDAPTAITPTSAHLSGSVDSNGVSTKYRFETSADNGATWTSTPELDAGEGEDPVPVEADLTGLEPNAGYLVRLASANTDGANDATATRGFVTVASAPQAATGGTSSLTESSVTLFGSINPFGLQTSYYFEYGTTAAYGLRAPVDHAAPAGAGRKPISVSQGISGLQPGVTYHYRVVASNGVGSAIGADRTFTTVDSSTASKRAYELVSPAEKQGSSVKDRYGFQAASNGNALTFTALAALGDDIGNSPYLNKYVARRTDSGWINVAADPPQLGYGGNDGPLQLTQAVSEDGTKAVVFSRKKLAPGAVEGSANVYIHHLDSRTYTTMATTPDPIWFDNVGSILISSPVIPFVGATPNFDHVLLYEHGQESTPPPFIPGAPEGALYDFTEGQLKLVSISPDGTPIAGGEVRPGTSTHDPRMISDDGSRILFGSETQNKALFIRADGVTKAISESRRTGDPPGTLQPARPVGAGRDMSQIYFFSQELLDSSAPGDTYLYRYDVASEDLVELSKVKTPSSFREPIPLQVSADGSSAFFVSPLALRPGAVADDDNVYVWRNGSLRLVVAAPETVINDEGMRLAYRFGNYWASPNGRYFVYRGVGPGGERCPYGDLEAKPCREILRYDTETGETACASCRPDGRLSGSPTPFIGNETTDTGPVFVFPPAVNNQGRVIFDSFEQLVSGDTNSAPDVYEYSDAFGARLISTGRGTGSRLASVSKDGNDVFFTTGDRLVREDVDNSIDAYDARVGGGIPTQNQIPPTACNGEDCRGQAPFPPAPPPGGSETTFGPGSQRARHGRKACGKGRQAQKVKGKKQRCVKKRKADDKKRAKNNRRQGR